MRIKLVNREEEFYYLREKWNNLLKKSKQDCFFLTWEWTYTWWKELRNNSKLYILLAIEEDRIYGIAPFVIAPIRVFKLLRIRKIRFLGQGEPANSNYLNFIICPEREEEIISLFVDYLKRNKNDWDAIDLTDILDDSFLVAIFCENLKKKKLTFSVAPTPENSPYIILLDTWDNYLNSIGSKTRYNLRKFDRKLRSDYQVEFKKIDSRELIEDNFNKFIKMHEKRWKRKGEFNYFLMPSFDKFNLELMKLTLEKGWLEFYVLMINNKEEGYLYGFNYNGKIYGYQASISNNYAKYGIGMLQISYWIKNSIERKFLEFLFLSGDEPHKYKFTKISKKCIQILVAKKNIKGLVIKLEEMLLSLRASLTKKIKSSEYLSKLVKRVKIFVKKKTYN